MSERINRKFFEEYKALEDAIAERYGEGCGVTWYLDALNEVGGNNRNGKARRSGANASRNNRTSVPKEKCGCRTVETGSAENRPSPGNAVRILIRLRHIRNELAHDANAFGKDLATAEDIRILEEFTALVRENRDPLAGRHPKLIRVLKYILLALMLLFIWGQSALPPDLSDTESLAVTGWISAVLSAIFGNALITNGVVRKLAHFTEYAVLGILLVWCTPGGTKRKIARYGMSLNAGLVVAFLDETIQIFSGRNPAITDVWIDLAGAFIGILISFLIRRRVMLQKKGTYHHE